MVWRFLVRPHHSAAAVGSASSSGRFSWMGGFSLDSKGRAVALANLQAAFGEERDLADRKVIARRSLQLFGRSFLELFWSARLNANNLERFLYFEDDSIVKKRCSSKSPPAPIFLTIHSVTSSGRAPCLLSADTMAVY